jgi:hypothetical protein
LALGCYWLSAGLTARLLRDCSDIKGWAYRSVPAQTHICVLGLILVCTVITPVRYRQPSESALCTPLFTRLSANAMLAFLFVMQWPGIVQRAGLGRSGFAELAAR